MAVVEARMSRQWFGQIKAHSLHAKVKFLIGLKYNTCLCVTDWEKTNKKTVVSKW